MGIIIIMKLLAAVQFIILAHASCYVPSVLSTKGGMGDNTAATATMEDGSNNDERQLASSSSTGYKYTRNYLTIIQPEDFVTVFPDGAINIGSGVPSLVGSSTIQKGGVYDPADIDLVNKLNGVGPEDLTPAVLASFNDDEGDALDAIGGFKFAGDRQPKQPVPPGDSAFFYHGECVVNSAISSPFPQKVDRQLGPGLDIEGFLASITVLSHTCNLNICLGGGGFNCIAFYSGTSFVFDIGEQISSPKDLDYTVKGDIKLPPPFPSTIIGGTGSFEGIEGTVDIATICGTTGPILTPCDGCRRALSGGKTLTFTKVRLGSIVQTISIKSNMPLPVAP